jgi:dipeptidase E
MRPHLNAEYFPCASMEMMELAASRVDVPLYAMDDETAIRVDGGLVEVVSEGEWRVFNA